MRLFLLITAFILLSINLISPAASFAETKEADTPVIKNFGKVDDNYYRGAKIKPEHYMLLKNLGVKAEIDLRDHNDERAKKFRKIATDQGLKYFSIPMNPFANPKPFQLEQFLSIINNPDNLPVYVHCTHGQDRTGFMTGLYRIEKYNWNYDDVYAEMLKYGYHNNLYGQYKDYLKDYILNKGK